MTRAEALIRDLQLSPHPEGGWYREIFRSEERVRPLDNRSERNAMTVIYFLLESGQRSRWHRVRSDETWTFLEGDPLALFRRDALSSPVSRLLLGPLSLGGALPVHIIPAGNWQAAEPLGSYTLVSCTVAPGFEFEDFEMIDDQPPDFGIES